MRNGSRQTKAQAQAVPEITIRELRESGVDGGGWMGCWAKGHHAPDAFMAAAARTDFEWDGYGRRPLVHAWMIQQDWWRCVPMAGEPGCWEYRAAVPKSRGAFPATYFSTSELAVFRWKAERKWTEADAWRAAADYSLDHSVTVFRARIGNRKVGSLIGLNREDVIARERARSDGSYDHLALEVTHVR
ncbi:hypothetical protein [Azospirillum doebereinerae]|uniref:Uncharacterized protein n=1 Tax=Azospirillum doebereinerae TaxID=92933 RepID=A0A3S0WUQ4_9PROT|nr:hypothetical protein [Azospirillum doebereinerae]RUQ61238.1 hypothetical protein EJ913_30000 [Azospirillum doebereinerae]